MRMKLSNQKNKMSNVIQKTMRGQTFLSFVGGMVIGIVFFFIWKNALLANSKKVLGELLTWKQYTDLKQSMYLLYILRYRGKSIILFILFAGLWNRQIASRLFLMAFGFQFGIIAAVGITLYRVLGLLFTACIYFPHGICYVIAVVLLGKMNRNITYSGITESNIAKNRSISRLELYSIIMGMVFTVIGILFEVYANLKIFFKFIKILKIL